jgi:ureidoacrylate peracid hydrolase
MRAMNVALSQLLKPSSTALLVIDVQNDYVHPEGALGLMGADMAPCLDMIPRLERFLDAARDAGLFVVHTRNWHRPATDSPAWAARVTRSWSLDDRPGRAGSWGAEFYRVGPRDGEEVISKFRYDAFLGTNLEYLLRARGIETVICTGVTTNVCVESTARAAHMRDFNLVLVSDCCASSEQDLHDATLANIERHFGTVVTSDRVLATWAELGAPRSEALATVSVASPRSR